MIRDAGDCVLTEAKEHEVYKEKPTTRLPDYMTT